jgi:hypothetical protein
MASSGDTGPSIDTQSSPEHNSVSKSLAGAHEAHPTLQPEASQESDGTPSIDDAIPSDGDVSKRNHHMAAGIYLRNKGGYRFCCGRAKWNVCARREHISSTAN